MIDFIKQILIFSRLQKQILVYAIDLSFFVFSLFISIIIRFDLYLFRSIFEYRALIFGIIIFTIFYIFFGLYRTIFRFSNLNIIRIIFLIIFVFFIIIFKIINIKKLIFSGCISSINRFGISYHFFCRVMHFALRFIEKTFSFVLWRE